MVATGRRVAARRERPAGRFVRRQRHAHRMEIRSALGAAGRLAGPLHGGQQERHEHAEDADHHEQFHQGKARPGHGPLTPDGCREIPELSHHLPSRSPAGPIDHQGATIPHCCRGQSRKEERPYVGIPIAPGPHRRGVVVAEPDGQRRVHHGDSGSRGLVRQPVLAGGHAEPKPALKRGQASGREHPGVLRVGIEGPVGGIDPALHRDRRVVVPPRNRHEHRPPGLREDGFREADRRIEGDVAIGHDAGGSWKSLRGQAEQVGERQPPLAGIDELDVLERGGGGIRLADVPQFRGAAGIRRRVGLLNEDHAHTQRPARRSTPAAPPPSMLPAAMVADRRPAFSGRGPGGNHRPTLRQRNHVP